jgi:hypothetical protein
MGGKPSPDVILQQLSNQAIPICHCPALHFSGMANHCLNKFESPSIHKDAETLFVMQVYRAVPFSFPRSGHWPSLFLSGGGSG